MYNPVQQNTKSEKKEEKRKILQRSWLTLMWEQMSMSIIKSEVISDMNRLKRYIEYRSTFLIYLNLNVARRADGFIFELFRIINNIVYFISFIITPYIMGYSILSF